MSAGALARWGGPAAVYLTASSLILLALATALQFWAFPWGSYADEASRFDDPLPRYGGTAQALGSRLYTAGIALLAWSLVRQRAFPWWACLALVVTAPTSLLPHSRPALVRARLAGAGAALWSTGRRPAGAAGDERQSG